MRTEIEIARPRSEVAAYAADPDNATSWYENIKTVEWDDALGGGTHMTLRNRGEPAGFKVIAAPLMVRAMRRANQKDLDRLKQLLEGAVVRDP